MTVGKPRLHCYETESYVEKKKNVFSSFNGELSYNFEFVAAFFFNVIYLVFLSVVAIFYCFAVDMASNLGC